MKNLSGRQLLVLALMMCGTLLLAGSRIYGVLYLPPSEQLSVWPIWVVALVSACTGVWLLRNTLMTK